MIQKNWHMRAVQEVGQMQISHIKINKIKIRNEFMFVIDSEQRLVCSLHTRSCL